MGTSHVKAFTAPDAFVKDWLPPPADEIDESDLPASAAMGKRKKAQNVDSDDEIDCRRTDKGRKVLMRSVQRIISYHAGMGNHVEQNGVLTNGGLMSAGSKEEGRHRKLLDGSKQDPRRSIVTCGSFVCPRCRCVGQCWAVEILESLRTELLRVSNFESPNCSL